MTLIKIDHLLSNIFNYLHANPVFTLATGAVLAILILRRPKLFIILTCFLLVLAGLMRIMHKLSSIGLGNI